MTKRNHHLPQLNASDLIRFFQLDEPSVYYRDDSSQNSLTTLDIIRCGLANIGLQTYIDACDDLDTMKIHSLGAAVNEYGSFIAHIDATKDTTRRAVIVSGNLSKVKTPQGDMPYVEYYFIMAGEYDQATHQFITDDILCGAVIEDSDEKQFVAPREKNEFYATLCYAHTCLKTVLRNEPIDIQLNQFWLEAEPVSQAATEYDRLKGMTLAELHKDMEVDKHIEAAGIFAMPQPPTLQ